ncbi:MAG: UvrD-helicase domain-containing protein, partial [Pseudomonadota bacterium]
MPLNNIQKIAIQPYHSIWLEASAGTGKTKVLTDRVLMLLLNGASIDKILCLTFTKNAASEMQQRIEQKLRLWSELTDTELRATLAELMPDVSTAIISRAQQLFNYYLNHEHKLNIQTIHSFCLQLIEQFPGEVGLAPNFTLLDDLEQQQLQLQAVDLCATKSSTLLIALLRFISLDQLRLILPYLAAHSINHAELTTIYQQRLGLNSTLLSKDNDLTNLDNSFTNNLFNTLQQLLTRHDAELLATSTSKTDQQLGSLLAHALTTSNLTWQQLLTITHTKTLTNKKRLVTKGAPNANKLQNKLQQLQLQYDSALENYKAELTLNINCHLSRFIEQYHAEYAKLKLQLNAVDYSDLINKTNNLLNNQEQRAWIAYRLDGFVEHILVDEAQDTSPSQWQVITIIIE